jgi:hypothetical protein
MVGVSMRGPRRMRRAREGQWGSPRRRLDEQWQSGDDAALLIGGEALRRSAASSYGIREEGKRSDAARLRWGDTLAALTVKEATEIRNSARGLELRRHGADEQCLRTEGEVATCSTVDQRRGGVLAAERCDGRRSTAFDRSAGEWGGGVRLGVW